MQNAHYSFISLLLFDKLMIYSIRIANFEEISSFYAQSINKKVGGS